MKNCPKCGTEMEESCSFCPNCGNRMSSKADVYDHSAEFSESDISENKVYAMLGYLTGILGIIVALLASAESPYIKFHIRQLIKFTVAQALLVLLSGVLCWTIIVPVLGALSLIVLTAIQIICFFRVCSGKSVEPEIIRVLPFLK